MLIQKCEKCSNKFTWTEIEKSIIKNYTPITCSKCKTVHKVQYSSRFNITIGIILIFLIHSFVLSKVISFRYSGAISIILAIELILIAPIFTKYTSSKL
jgi:CXXC-20-CXXC protein